MKPETIKAIIETRTKVGNLGKAAFNPHGRYKYVSIDTYYEKVAAAAAANGLAWVATERSFELLPDIFKAPTVRITYSVTLMHSSGEVIPDFSVVTIVHPVQGAQTVGSAMSYLDKVFMRQLFSVATGEAGADADETDPADVMLRPSKPSPAPKEVAAPEVDAPEKFPMEAGLKQSEDVFVKDPALARTEEELVAFWQENIKAIDLLKTSAPDRYKRVLASFTERRAQLKKLTERNAQTEKENV